jgi:hypothetical protein
VGTLRQRRRKLQRESRKVHLRLSRPVLAVEHQAEAGRIDARSEIGNNRRDRGSRVGQEARAGRREKGDGRSFRVRHGAVLSLDDQMEAASGGAADLDLQFVAGLEGHGAVDRRDVLVEVALLEDDGAVELDDRARDALELLARAAVVEVEDVRGRGIGGEASDDVDRLAVVPYEGFGPENVERCGGCLSKAHTEDQREHPPGVRQPHEPSPFENGWNANRLRRE